MRQTNSMTPIYNVRVIEVTSGEIKFLITSFKALLGLIAFLKGLIGVSNGPSHSQTYFFIKSIRTFIWLLVH